MRPTAHPARTRLVHRVVAPVAVLGLGFGMIACGDDDDVDEPSTTDVTSPPIDDPPGNGNGADDGNDGADPDVGLEDDFDESSIIGFSEDEARDVVEAGGRDFRVAMIDGERQALTDDLVEGRVNVSVTDGVVDGVEFSG